jgi:hypothetical protein
VRMLRGLITATPTARCTCTSACPTRPRRSSPTTACARTCRCCRRSRPTRPTGTASTRASRRRARRCSAPIPRSEIPRAFRGYADYERTIDRSSPARRSPTTRSCGGTCARTRCSGTVEVRAMDAQADLDSVAGLAALVHGLAPARGGQPATGRRQRRARGVELPRRPRRPARDDLVRRRAARRARGRREGGQARPPPRRRARARADRAHRARGQRRRPPARRPRRGGLDAVLEQLVADAQG